MISNPNTPNGKVKELKNLQCDNMFQILDFLDKKKKFEKMLEEVEIYVAMLLELDQYPQIEETYIWLYQHAELSND